MSPTEPNQFSFMTRVLTQEVAESLAQLTNMQTSKDGTTKLLIKLKSTLESGEALLVETVIIPWSERNKSTLCVR